MKDLYEEGYMHCGLRPEHFVLVDNEWKLETLVLDNEFHTDSLYSWTPIFASPEEKKSKDSGLLDEDVLMAQLVWRFAIIAVFLLLGEHVV